MSEIEEELERLRKRVAELEESELQTLSVRKSLRDSEEMLEAILNTAVDAIITIDERGEIVSYNPSAERMFGYGPHETIGRKVDMLMPSPHREQHDEYIARYLATGKASSIERIRERD